MASNVPDNANNIPVETKTDVSSIDPYSKISKLPPDSNDSRSNDLDGAQSPASSTYGDCEETGSPSSENLHDLSETKPIHATTVDITSIEKVDENLLQDLTKRKSSLSSNDSNAKVEEKLSSTEPDSPSQPKEEQININENYEGIDSRDGNFNGTIDDGLDKNENFHDENCLESRSVSDTVSSNVSEFDTDEHENDRENGDGQEGNEDGGVVQKKLDDDEDKRNPQYIPKRGFFYEHDNRTNYSSTDDEADDNAKKKEVKEPEPRGRNRRSIPDGRWEHDLYKEDEQRPKSTQELVDIYGYDIRNEESAPKARRRRKYGRGPNKYTRNWDDENAYAKKVSSKQNRIQRQQLPRHRDEYEAQFPSIKGRTTHPQARSRDRRELTPKHSANHESPKSDTEMKFKDEHRNHAPPKAVIPTLERSRSFTQRVPTNRDRSIPKNEHAEKIDPRNSQKPLRASVAPAFGNLRSRGRGITAGRNPRYSNSYEQDHRHYEFRAQSALAGRGRGQRFVRPSQFNHGGKQYASDEDIQELSHQMSSVDLKSVKRTIINRSLQPNDAETPKSNEPTMNQSLPAANSVRSKRYSHQRQRLLPDSTSQNTLANVNLAPPQSVSTTMTHKVQNMTSDGNIRPAESTTHPTLSYVTQETQMRTAPPPNNDPTLTAVNASSISSSSMAVSASLIPLSAPPLTASGTALSSAAPPLPIVGFFQHPQGYTNQPAPAQLYSRDQSVMGGPSNQPVQLVAFLPASPMIPNANHSQAAPPPPPPPPPPTYPTTVMSYPQVSQTQQTQPSFNTETYSLPPVTLAAMPQAPEMYQSRGGVTYYNTRSQYKPRSPPPPRVKIAIPIVPPPSNEGMK